MTKTNLSSVARTSTAAAVALLSALSAGPAGAQTAAAPQVSANAPATTAAPAPPPPPYSLPWQLRPVTVATVLRSDTSVAVYENAAGQSGSTVATMFLGSYKVTPELAPLFRVGLVQNSEPGPAVGSASALVNPILGVTYGRKLGAAFRGSAFLGTTLPIGMGGDKAAGMDATAAATSRGITARSAMDNAMFAVNYMTGIFGLGGAYIGHGLTVQAEATLLQLFRARNEKFAPESTRTNFTTGLHVGYFVASFLSFGGEARYQRWLSTPNAVKANSAARDTMTVAIGPRFHFKAGGLWLRPGLSYSTALDAPAKDLDYHIFQIDVPLVF